MSDFSRLDGWLEALLSRLSPAQQLRVNRLVAQRVREMQRVRIAAQQNPDGTAFAPRATALRQKQGAIARRGPMFQKLRTARHLKIRVAADEISTGFSGRAGMIAARHHYGNTRTDQRGRKYKTPARKLLGLTDANQEEIVDMYLEAIATFESS